MVGDKPNLNPATIKKNKIKKQRGTLENFLERSPRFLRRTAHLLSESKRSISDREYGGVRESLSDYVRDTSRGISVWANEPKSTIHAYKIAVLAATGISSVYPIIGVPAILGTVLAWYCRPFTSFA